MIASLRGRLAGVLPDGAVIDVGGVGYRVFLTPKALASLPRGGEVLVHTVTYVREDTLALYGFLSADERHAFELLLGASGVGPKLALALLSVHSPDALRRAITAGDADALTLVPGIGRKGATRPRSSPGWSRGTCCSSTRSTACPGRSRRSSTPRWRTSRSTSCSARARAPAACGWTCRASRWSRRRPAP